MHHFLETPPLGEGVKSDPTEQWPLTDIEPIIDEYHGIEVVDPYRWLEDGVSTRTRNWIEEQTRFTREHLHNLPGRDQIRKRTAELLSTETYEPPQKSGNRYFFRKRSPGQEQPCIYMREGIDGEDHLLIDPASRNSGNFTSVKIVAVSKDATLLAYEVKQGGEYSREIEILHVENRRVLPDRLPRGLLRSFIFGVNNKSFYYVHECPTAADLIEHVAFQHILGTDPTHDRRIFSAGYQSGTRLVVCTQDGRCGLAIVQTCGVDATNTLTDMYLIDLENDTPAKKIVSGVEGRFRPTLHRNRIFAVTNNGAPNSRIVEINCAKDAVTWREVVAESESRIQDFALASDHLCVTYTRDLSTSIDLHDLVGNKTGELSLPHAGTAEITHNLTETDEFFYTFESFTQPPTTFRYSPKTGKQSIWSQRRIPLDHATFAYRRIWCPSKDGTLVPIFLVAKQAVLTDYKPRPVVMTAYGGFGKAQTPQFGIFTSFMMERGCIFALLCVRGGGEFGVAWHLAGKRRNRQNSVDDFISVAEWLIANGYTRPEKLAAFGGCNSGLLVAAALTQRPELFRVVMCIAPLLDMLRYDKCKLARKWADEYGLADDPEDFKAISAYSPYQRVEDGIAYPAALFIAGDRDMSVDPMHARKMTARMQAASASKRLVLLDYSSMRGHAPVLPLTFRIDALTDRLAFMCHELGVEI